MFVIAPFHSILCVYVVHIVFFYVILTNCICICLSY